MSTGEQGDQNTPFSGPESWLPENVRNHLEFLGSIAAGNPAAELSLEVITDRMSELQYVATHDKLTGLLNISGLDIQLTYGHPPRAMLYVDGTNQKAVNDKLGHARGDETIIETAKILHDSLRPGDVAARIGGDEFLVLLDTKKRSTASAENDSSLGDILEPVIDRIRLATQTFLAQNTDLQKIGFDIAVGGVIWEAGKSAEDIRRIAEESMYKDKESQHEQNGQYRP